MTPAVSITVLNYNYGHYLGECLRSILAQSFGDFEVIVIDDCSSDDSLAVVEPFLADARVRLVAHAENAGFARSLIEGTEVHSRGEFLAVVSADDLLTRDDALETLVAMLRAHPAAAFAFAAVERIGAGGAREVHRSFAEDVVLDAGEGLRRLLLDRQVWPEHSGTVIRRSAYDACGGYRRDIAMPLDLGLWLALAMEGGFAYCARPLQGYRVHAGQMSISLPRMRRNAREVARILRDACRLGEARGLGTGGLVTRALRSHLAGNVTYDAFSAGRRAAGARIAATFAECPREMAGCREFWLATVRVGLGERAFAVLRRAARFGRGPLAARTVPGGTR